MKAIGLMSGTSMDGVDVALLDTDGEVIGALGPSATFPYEIPERQLLREAVNSARSLTRRDDRSGVLGIAETMLTAKHVRCVQDFAAMNAVDLRSIDIIGFHGQTVVHRPEKAFTIQLGDGEALCSALRVPVVFDFRANDMANGGQGAPLVPIFHYALASQRFQSPVAFVNIGGIANVTFVAHGGPQAMMAFDTGPGNCLLDDWAYRHTGEAMDRDARLALAGTVNDTALRTLLSDPFFSLPPPRSVDRGYFTLDAVESLSPQDGAATLTAFTVATISAAARLFPAAVSDWIMTGGGARNVHAMEGLRRILRPEPLMADDIGLNADAMEAQAFAYLAARFLRGLPSTFKGTTGVREPAIAGRMVRPVTL